MTPQETLRARKSQFEKLLYDNIDHTLSMTIMQAERVSDDAQARQMFMQRLTEMSDAADAYRQALTDAAPFVTQEVGEDYRKAARELPSQITFLWSALSAYRTRKTGA